MLPAQAVNSPHTAASTANPAPIDAAVAAAADGTAADAAAADAADAAADAVAVATAAADAAQPAAAATATMPTTRATVSRRRKLVRAPEQASQERTWELYLCGRTGVMECGFGGMRTAGLQVWIAGGRRPRDARGCG
jgi:hypothetical protein